MLCFSACFGKTVTTDTLPTPTLISDRGAYDETLRKHLVQHATPHRVELTVQAATLFLKRAHHARQVVQERQAKGCQSDVAHGPSAKARHEEEDRASFSREEAIQDGLKLLQQRAAATKVKVIHMEDDGNCQFRALATELYGDQKFHGTVRKTVCDRLASHAMEYSFYIGDDAEWQQYLAKMATPRTWGDELTLRAACDAYGVVVHVVTTEHDNWLLHYSPDAVAVTDGTPPAGTRECFLAYVSPIHYNVIEPLDGGTHAASATGY